MCRPFEHCECKLGFIPLMKKDRHRVGEVVRLYNQIDYHFQWIKWGLEVKTETVDEFAAIHEAIELGDDDEEKEGDTKQDDVHEAARGILAMGRPVGEEDATTHRSVATAQYIDGREYHPSNVGRELYKLCWAMDTPMDHSRTAESEMHYPARLICVFYRNNRPLQALVDWEDYTDRVKRFQIVGWDDIQFADQLGKGKRKRKRPDYLSLGHEEKKKGKRAGRKIELTERMQEVVNLLNGDDDDEESVKGRDARLEDMAKRLADETNNGDE